jgi:competence protein ComEC
LQVGFEEANVHVASAGQQYQLGASTTLLILSPAGNPEEWESNTASIVVQLQYGEVEFLLTGDAPLNIEEYLVGEYNHLLESEVLKLGHHGSRTSTANIFLDVVKPKYAVVSAGKENRYGHPHQEVLDKLEERNIAVFSTADAGTLIFKSDGNEVWAE